MRRLGVLICTHREKRDEEKTGCIDLYIYREKSDEETTGCIDLYIIIEKRGMRRRLGVLICT